ncbi:MAG: hypothetical protein LBT03_01155 [Holosporales bacterium]|jgi:hypothetical protein|nr:hypothetical protein [Holosporales bacterium]
MRKLFWFLLAILVCCILQVYSPNVEKVTIFALNKEISVGLYIVIATLITAIYATSIVKSFFRCIGHLFSKRKNEDGKVVEQLAELAILNDRDFERMFDKIQCTNQLSIMKTALAIRRRSKLDKIHQMTGIPRIDIEIIKLNLKDALNKNDEQTAVKLANKSIKNYAEHVSVVQNEILEVAKLTKKSNIQFKFDPRRFKYDLSQRFITKYMVTLGLMKFDAEIDIPKKLQIIQKLHNEYPEDITTLFAFLDFVDINKSTGYDSGGYDDKKLLKIIKETISLNPNRKIARYLLKLNRCDIFEIAQKVLEFSGNGNSEKLWILLIIATKMKFINKASELIRLLLESGDSCGVLEFYVQNIDTLSVEDSIKKMMENYASKISKN